MTNILVNPGTTTAVATIDIGSGVESPRVNLINGTGLSLYGTAGSPPAGSTVLSVQGVSGGFAQPVSGTVTLGAGTAAVGTTTALQGGTWTVGLSAGTLAIGTTTALQGGTWTVQPGNTQNTIPWLIQPVSTASINQAGTWTVQPGNTQNTTPWLVGQAVGSAYAMNITQIGTTAVGTTVGLSTLIRDGAGAARFANVNASSQLSVSVDGGTLNAQISSTATLNTNMVQVGSATINLGAGTGGTGTIRTIIDSSQLSPLGQTTMASSVPVAIASDQGPVPIYALSANSVSSAIGPITGTAVVTLLPSPGASNRNYLTQLLVTNAHATTSSVVVIGDGTLAATMTQGYAVAAGGGFSVPFPQPLRQPTTNTALSAYCITTGSSIYISASGFKGT